VTSIPTTLHVRVGTALPTIPINLTDAAGATLDLSAGWTGKLYIATYDQPNTILHTINATLAATSPNFLIAPDATDWGDVITAWGLTLPSTGYPFKATPWLDRTSDSADDEWNRVEILLWIHPAVTLPT
jgi:hypothetical protein